MVLNLKNCHLRRKKGKQHEAMDYSLHVEARNPRYKLVVRLSPYLKEELYQICQENTTFLVTLSENFSYKTSDIGYK